MQSFVNGHEVSSCFHLFPKCSFGNENPQFPLNFDTRKRKKGEENVVLPISFIRDHLGFSTLAFHAFKFCKAVKINNTNLYTFATQLDSPI